MQRRLSKGTVENSTTAHKTLSKRTSKTSLDGTLTEQAVQRRLSKAPSATLLTVEVPCYVEAFVNRQSEETTLRERIQDLTHSPDKGFLFVACPPGIGKTRLLANVLSNASHRDFLANQCNVQVAFWVNCAKYNAGGLTGHEFTAEIAGLARRAAHDTSVALPDIKSIMYLFERLKNRRILFILDNATTCDPAILDCLKGFSCILLYSGDSIDPSFEHLKRDPPFTVQKMPLEALDGFLDQNIKPKVPSAKLNMIMQKCHGLPLMAKLCMARMKLAENASDMELRKVVDTLSKQPSLDAAGVVGSVLDLLTETQLGRLCVFLFWEVELTISMIELAVLWDVTTIDATEAICREFETMGLITKVEPHFQERCSRVVMHPVIRSTAIQSTRMAKFLRQPNNLSGCAFLAAAKHGFCTPLADDYTFDTNRSMLGLVDRTVTHNRWDLLEKIMRYPAIARFIYQKYPEAAPLSDNTKQTALLLAAKIGSLELAKLLYGQHKDAIRTADRHHGRLPLSWAIASDAPLELIGFLYDQYPEAIEVQDRFFKQTPLCLAAEHCGLETVRMLFNKYEEAIQIEDTSGRLPLSAAAEGGRLEIVKFLFDQYPDGVKSGMPFRLAVEQGHIEVVKFLHSKYPEGPTLADDEGVLPATLASTNGFDDVAEFLQKSLPMK